MLNGLSEARAGRAGLVRAGRWAGSWREYNHPLEVRRDPRAESRSAPRLTWGREGTLCNKKKWSRRRGDDVGGVEKVLRRKTEITRPGPVVTAGLGREAGPWTGEAQPRGWLPPDDPGRKSDCDRRSAAEAGSHLKQPRLAAGPVPGDRPEPIKPRTSGWVVGGGVGKD